MAEAFPFQSRSHQYAGQLEALADDPAAVLDVLSRGLEIDDLESRLGITAAALTISESHESAAKIVDTLRRLVALFSLHGTISPVQQGLWLTEPNAELIIGGEMGTPLEMLVLDAQRNGPTQDNIWRIFRTSRTFLRPSDQGVRDIWRVIRSGSGEFTIPLHEH